MTLRPSTTIAAEFGPEADLRVHRGASWAVCPSARNITSGALLLLFDCPPHFVSETQSVIALSSAEGGLCAIGTGAGEAVHVRSCLMGARLLVKLNAVVETDSSSGKTVATMFDTTKKA